MRNALSSLEKTDGVAVTILFPARNEEISIGETLREYYDHFPLARYVVIDNNSSDRTACVAAEVFATLCVEGHVIFESRVGKANAIRSALSRFDADIFVMVDADFTYPAESMRGIVDAMLKFRFDHGVADRLTNQAYVNEPGLRTWLHRAGNQAFSKLVSLLTQSKFNDVFSGGRVFSQPFVATLQIESDGFQLETELNLHASEIDAVTVEQPSRYRNRESGNPSKLSTFADGWRILCFIARWAIIRKPDTLFVLASGLIAVPGVWMAVRLFGLYFERGGVPYPSSAVAASVLIVASLQLALFGIAIKVFRAQQIKTRRSKFARLKREWNSKLDVCAALR